MGKRLNLGARAGNAAAVKSRIRLATPADAPAVCRIYGPFCATPVTFEEVAPDESEMERRIGQVTGQYPWLVCESGGAVVGYAYAAAHRERAAYRWTVEVAAYVAANCRGCGVGGALYTTLIGLLTAQGYHRAFGLITLPNPASVELHESMGFTAKTVFQAAGFKCGEWRDVGWWERRLCPDSGKPTEPVSVRKLRDTSEWRAAIAAGERRLAERTRETRPVRAARRIRPTPGRLFKRPSSGK
jgi:phosphinothricin acetyltransferase